MLGIIGKPMAMKFRTMVPLMYVNICSTHIPEGGSPALRRSKYGVSSDGKRRKNAYMLTYCQLFSQTSELSITI